jgi:hypothetical protein
MLMEKQTKSFVNKPVKILPYFSSSKELPSSFKVNKRYGVYDKIQRYKAVINSADLKEEGLYNSFTNETFKKSYKIKK